MAVVKNILGFIFNPMYRIIKYSNRFSIIRDFPYTSREKIMKTAMDFVKSSKVDGDYLEFGVYRGESFISSFHFSKMNKLNSMKFYAFDSFEGLPELKGIDIDKSFQFNIGKYACDLDAFKRNISRKGVDMSRVKIIPGWYNKVLNIETKKRLSIKKAAVILIDCDLYESTVPVLNFITDYIQDGTVLIFDDWFCFSGHPNKGEQRAFREWLKKNSSIRVTEFHKFGWHGNSFIVHFEG